MSQKNPDRVPTAVDDVRIARASICHGGFAGLGEHLRRVRQQYRARTGEFIDVPDEQPESVRRLIESAEVDEPLIEELQSVRTARGQGAGT